MTGICIWSRFLLPSIIAALLTDPKLPRKASIVVSSLNPYCSVALKRWFKCPGSATESPSLTAH